MTHLVQKLSDSLPEEGKIDSEEERTAPSTANGVQGQDNPAFQKDK